MRVIDNWQGKEETAFLITTRDSAVQALLISVWRKFDAASQMGLPLLGYSVISPQVFRGDGQATASVC